MSQEWNLENLPRLLNESSVSSWIQDWNDKKKQKVCDIVNKNPSCTELATAIEGLKHNELQVVLYMTRTDAYYQGQSY